MPPIEAARICLIRTSAVGDVIHTLALVNGLRHGYPEAHLTWIIHPLGHEVVRHQPGVDRFIVIPRHGRLAPWRQLARELRGERFDLLLLPQVSIKAGLMSALVRAPIRLGFDLARSREGHFLFVNRHLPAREPRHVQDQYLEFLDALGITGYPVEWNLTFTAEELAWRREFFAGLVRPVIAFVAASSNPEKDWPAAAQAEAMEQVARLGHVPLLAGGASERERQLAAEIVRRCRVEVVVGLEPSIRRTLLQLSGAAVVVAPDTGPLHAAVAMGVPTVGLYGASDPRRCGPYRFKDLLIDHFAEPGETLGRIRRVKRRGRMAGITPADVIEKIELALQRYPRTPH
ncbi:MAG: glycosyltransferase family 9 protein [Acidobacteriota bacterium]